MRGYLGGRLLLGVRVSAAHVARRAMQNSRQADRNFKCVSKLDLYFEKRLKDISPLK